MVYHPAIIMFFITTMCLLQTGTAQARPEFAKKFAAKCRTCHIKNTAAELNSTGLDFKKTLDQQAKTDQPATGEQKAAAKKPTEPLPQIMPQVKSEVKAAPGTPSAKEGDGAETLEIGETPPQPYRWTTSDGTLVFSDNQVKYLEQGKAGLQSRPRAEKHPKQPVVASPQPHKTMRITTKQKVTEVARGPAYRTYAECMEQALLNQPQPGSASEFNALLMNAEDGCAYLQPAISGGKQKSSRTWATQ